jgi:hypothetical protein
MTRLAGRRTLDIEMGILEYYIRPWGGLLESRFSAHRGCRHKPSISLHCSDLAGLICLSLDARKQITQLHQLQMPLK